MAQNRSRYDLIKFLEYLGDKGLIPQGTASARRTAAAKVLAVLSEDEAQDVIGIDLNHVMSRFDNLNPHQYTPESLQAYRSRLKTALEDFRSYCDNPVSFRPSGQGRNKIKKADGVSKVIKKTAVQEPIPSTSPAVMSPIVDLPNVNQLPIPLRQNLTVRVFGLPFDLTAAEAKKIANIILAHAIET
jgi:hypothetical protein